MQHPCQQPTVASPSSAIPSWSERSPTPERCGPPPASEARLLRDLALVGARAAETDEERRRMGIEAFIADSLRDRPDDRLALDELHRGGP